MDGTWLGVARHFDWHVVGKRDSGWADDAFSHRRFLFQIGSWSRLFGFVPDRMVSLRASTHYHVGDPVSRDQSRRYSIRGEFLLPASSRLALRVDLGKTARLNEIDSQRISRNGRQGERSFAFSPGPVGVHGLRYQDRSGNRAFSRLCRRRNAGKLLAVYDHGRD